MTVPYCKHLLTFFETQISTPLKRHIITNEAKGASRGLLPPPKVSLFFHLFRYSHRAPDEFHLRLLERRKCSIHNRSQYPSLQQGNVKRSETEQKDNEDF